MGRRPLDPEVETHAKSLVPWIARLCEKECVSEQAHPKKAFGSGKLVKGFGNKKSVESRHTKNVKQIISFGF